MKTTLIAKIFFLLSALVLTFAVEASQLYGTDTDPVSFYKIDATDGSYVVLDTFNGAYSLGLAFNPLTNTMYSVGFFNGTLSTINLANGNTTLIGTTDFANMNGLTFSGDYSTLYSLSDYGGKLISVNPTDATVMVISDSDIGGGVLDLATDLAGNVFACGWDGIYSIDTNTGKASLIGGGVFWTAIAFDENDTLYGIHVDNDALYIINTNDGSSSLVGGDIGKDVRGLAFDTESVFKDGFESP